MVCELPADIRRRLGAHTSIVRIRRDYVQKAVYKHGFKFEHLSMIETAILSGAAYENGRKQVVFFYRDITNMNNNLFVALKTIADGSEVWIKSLHWKDEKDKRRIVGKSTKIR